MVSALEGSAGATFTLVGGCVALKAGSLGPPPGSEVAQSVSPNSFSPRSPSSPSHRGPTKSSRLSVAVFASVSLLWASSRRSIPASASRRFCLSASASNRVSIRSCTNGNLTLTETLPRERCKRTGSLRDTLRIVRRPVLRNSAVCLALVNPVENLAKLLDTFVVTLNLHYGRHFSISLNRCTHHDTDNATKLKGQ